MFRAAQILLILRGEFKPKELGRQILETKNPHKKNTKQQLKLGSEGRAGNKIHGSQQNKPQSF